MLFISEDLLNMTLLLLRQTSCLSLGIHPVIYSYTSRLLGYITLPQGGMTAKLLQLAFQKATCPDQLNITY